MKGIICGILIKAVYWENNAFTDTFESKAPTLWMDLILPNVCWANSDSLIIALSMKTLRVILHFLQRNINQEFLEM